MKNRLGKGNDKEKMMRCETIGLNPLKLCLNERNGVRVRNSNDCFADGRVGRGQAGPCRERRGAVQSASRARRRGEPRAPDAGTSARRLQASATR